MFTHIWNPIGFPALHADEGTYMRRAMHIMEGHGPQEFPGVKEQNITIYDHSYQGRVFLYDHPYFGQLFLAAFLDVIGYPFALNNASINKDSIEFLYLFPRVLMGMLAVVDTFFIYKIAEWRYNRKIAIIAAILFAVMPIGWLLRRIYLDNLLLPFLLASILFAVRLRRPMEDASVVPSYSNNSINRKQCVLAIISGIFLGLAIFTKIPVFAFIPVAGFLVYTNTGKSIKALGLWFIPVVLIPLIWPAFALSVGQFDYWFEGVARQAGERDDKPLFDSLNTFLQIEPVFFLLGIAGVIYAAIRRDYMILLWVIPYLVFFYFISFTSIVYMVALIPPFCIAAGRMIVLLPSKIQRKNLQRILPFAIISILAVFGLVSISLLISINLNSSFFEVYAFITEYLPGKDEDNDGKTKLIGRYLTKSFVWIPTYVYQKNFDFIRDDSFVFYANEKRLPNSNDKILVIADGRMQENILAENRKDASSQTLYQYYNDTSIIARFEDDNIRYNRNTYPYASLPQTRGIGDIEIRANF